ncbi:armadillo repeat-containing protein [Dictyostelium discoideum AX4]|uniref:Probable inactive serine/threonine-protein kinase DDB_G0280131 n=1 Tax=Dictyostelium discoideum TaxID=44689 RepID=Y0038_DICDI|nr:armadillo repeat-containing protein [Dictyostelium discoideum AX4]Q54VU5.1 RecName: Full=Probable inactive serine/threonine-protein kinase DDB_G0280131 [Dictyostelium discoideum]EAL67292.1 armadillo repeat-containing protein [Dictyostelium discoideum AX4]|eukprot:XP_641260.1 armadillo repeat-containing protein [Dictyostelium discoideum AX4]
MSELDDLLNEMLAESEAALNGQSTINLNNNNSNNNNNNNNNGNSATKISFQEQMPNGNGNSSTTTTTAAQQSATEKRKSRLSQHPSNLNEGGFDYLDTLLNDMSDESIRNSIKTDNSRIKSLRLTSTFDLESTLKDLEETFMKDSSIQNKRKPSSYLSKNLSPPSNPSNIISNNNASTLPLPPPPSQQDDVVIIAKLPPPVSISLPPPPTTEELPLPPPSTEELQLPPPPPTTTTADEQILTDSVKNGNPILKRVSSERAIILTKEAIDAADLLDEMIESFGGIPEPNGNNSLPKEIKTTSIPTPIVTPSTTTSTNTTTAATVNKLNASKSPNGTLTTRPAAKLGAPVDIQVSSPKAPTPIPTLSSPSPSQSAAPQPAAPQPTPTSQPQPPTTTVSTPVSPTFKDSDQLLDDMISHFKESNSNLLTSSSNLDPSAPKVVYTSQQFYPLSVEEQSLQSKVKVQLTPDEQVIQKILGNNDLDDDITNKNNDNNSNGNNNNKELIDEQNQIEQQQSDKSWYIKAQPSDIIGSGNNGTTQRAGIHKDKRIVMKQWNFITSQATPMLFNEIEQLVAIKHPNILALAGASFDNQTFTTFTEYITGSNLDIVIKNLDEKNELQLILRLSEEIASAMSFLHSFNIVHRSLHPKNILLNSDLKIYIKDYGFTSLKDETLKKKFMSFQLKNQLLHTQYLAPELFNVLSGSKGGYDTKVDVFSFGVLLWEMFARDIKLSDLKSNTVNGYTHYLRPPLPNCPFTIEKLIKLCLSTDPSVRPTFTTILKILRQPLHTIQRFNKPTQQQQQQQQQDQQQQQPEQQLTSSTSSTSTQDSLVSQEQVEEKIKNEMNNLLNPNKRFNESLDPEKRVKIEKIANVVKDLISQPTLLNLHRASQTIDQLCKNVENIEYLLEADFVPLIFQLMDQPYDEIQLSCLKQFSTLIEHNEEIMNLFRNLLGINILMETLNSQKENILFITLRLLSQLSNGADREENREQILIKGGIPLLINLLSHQNELIRLQILWCLTLLLESNSVQVEFVKLGGVNQLLDMMVHSINSGFDLRVASALARVISLKSVQDQINLGHYRERVVKKYLSLLGDTQFEALRMLGLEAIACLVSNKDSQFILTASNIVDLLLSYLDPNSTSMAPQMTALKIILVLSVNPIHIPYLKSSNIIEPLQYLKSSPHPSIQKAVEKILMLVSSK